MILLRAKCNACGEPGEIGPCWSCNDGEHAITALELLRYLVGAQDDEALLEALGGLTVNYHDGHTYEARRPAKGSAVSRSYRPALRLFIG